jgi:hypothetical protein
LTILSEWRRVAFVEDFFDVIKEVHCKEKGHVGIKKTIKEVSMMYECLPRSAVEKFVELCTICHYLTSNSNEYTYISSLVLSKINNNDYNNISSFLKDELNSYSGIFIPCLVKNHWILVVCEN